MIEVEYTEPLVVGLEAVDSWSSLPEELSNPSFFMFSAEHVLILDLFCEAARQSDSPKLDNLLSLKLLTQSLVSVPSLLARVWTGVSYSGRARITALDRFTQQLQKGSSLDFQGFTPHLIIALSDPSKEIRNDAANAMQALHEIYSSSKKHS